MVSKHLGGWVEIVTQGSYRYLGVGIMKGDKHISSNIEINLWKYSIYINLRRPK